MNGIEQYTAPYTSSRFHPFRFSKFGSLMGFYKLRGTFRCNKIGKKFGGQKRAQGEGKRNSSHDSSCASCERYDKTSQVVGNQLAVRQLKNQLIIFLNPKAWSRSPKLQIFNRNLFYILCFSTLVPRLLTRTPQIDA